GTDTKIEIDWDDLHLRAQPVLRMTVNAVAISPDGNRIAFRAGDNDLYLANADGSQVTRITNGGQNPRQIRWARSGSMVYFLDGSGSLRLARTAGGDAPVPFRVRFPVSTQGEYTEMFDQGWRFLAENYYDANFHGKDWKAIRDKYR